ncbi:MAG: (d)CMP kinase [Desulfofustis sp.]|jgi:cytidylate kinase|nr:(d)CMP kinase [Desulfofustis sp.]
MSDCRREIVTIDGPAGVGKSTISRRVASRLGFTYLDTGAMYRAVAWYLRKHGVDTGDESAIAAALGRIDLELLPAGGEDDDVGVVVNGEDISGEIRSPDISMLASSVSALAPVREKLTALQRQAGERGNIVAEGRDTGTVVFPAARHKFFLDASPAARAARRARQLRERGEAVDEEKLLEMTIKRDRQDSERAIAPLRKAADATLVDTTDLSADQVLELVVAKISG